MSMDPRLRRVANSSFQKPPLLNEQSRGAVMGNLKGKANSGVNEPNVYELFMNELKLVYVCLLS